MDNNSIVQLRQIQLQILNEFVRICQVNSLRYCLYAGTCLGAVRHKGYIPWDDDIDVVMPRADYDKFIQITTKEDNSDFFLDYYTTNHSYGHNFAKFCKKHTLFIEPNGIRQAIYIDVFPQDKVPGPDFVAKSKIPVLIHKIDALTTVRRDGLKGRDFKTKIVFYITRWMPTRWLYCWEKKLMTRFEKTDAKYYLNYGTRYAFINETILITEFEPYVQMVFEGKKYHVQQVYVLRFLSCSSVDPYDSEFYLWMRRKADSLCWNERVIKI